MKFNLFALVAVGLLLFSCTKDVTSKNTGVCWRCHVEGVYPSGDHYDFYKDTCSTASSLAPNIVDDKGNDLSHTCELK